MVQQALRTAVESDNKNLAYAIYNLRAYIITSSWPKLSERMRFKFVVNGGQECTSLLGVVDMLLQSPRYVSEAFRPRLEEPQLRKHVYELGVQGDTMTEAGYINILMKV